MKNRIIVFAFMALSLFSCSKENDFLMESYENIESISSSSVSRLDPIKIVFSESVKYKDNAKKAIVFTPRLNGSYDFIDDRTFVFSPSSPYEGGSEIKMSVDIGLLLDGKSGDKGFVKNFLVSPAQFIVDFEPLNVEKDGNVEIAGVIEADIPVDVELLKKAFSVKREDGKDVKDVTFDVVQDGDTSSYFFSVKGIKKEERDVTYIVSYDMTGLEAQDKDFKTFNVLGKKNFEVTSYKLENGNTVAITYSDQLDSSQDLSTLVSMTSDVEFRCYLKAKKNVLKLYNNVSTWPDNIQITILKGAKSANGNVSKNDYTFTLKDSYDIPTVEFETKGNIVPSKDNAVVLIKTKNIKGIYMRAINVYGHNMLQFFQENTLGEDHYLESVGEPCWEGSFQFEWKDDMKNREVVRAIDITELVRKFPTGMFNLQVAFSKEDVVYKPKNPQTDFSHLPFPVAKFYSNSWKARSEYWKLYGDVLEDEDFWSQRKNPCHPAFYLEAYNYGLVARKDILVSNIALMAKKDVQGAVYARVCDIRTGKMVEGATVKAYSFAQHENASGKTDKDGFVFFENVKNAFFLKAEKDGSSAYLKVNEGGQISTAHFAVEGEVSKEGLKGYIYGERGIWRPGDEIHLCFILQDSKETLPKDIPLEFTLSDVLSTEVDRQVLNSSIGGIYRIDTKTAQDAKTGTYTARVKIGGNVWQKELKIESIIPNRLFVNLEPVSPLENGENDITLSSQWLHGAKASNLKAELDVRYVVDQNPFKDYKQYSFIAEHSKFPSTSERLWQGNLDDEGIVHLRLPMSVENAPGKLKAVCETRVYETSGVFSIENKVLDFSPYPAYVGFLLPKGDDSYREDLIYTNKDNVVNFVVLDKDGELIKQSRKIAIDVYRLDWKWWWEGDAYAESVYSSSSSITNKISAEIETVEGRGKWTFNIKDEDWGRYLLIAKDEMGGHVASSVFYVDTPYWSSRSDESSAETILVLQSGKEKYKTSEEVEVSFPSAKDSFAYITLEKAGKVIETKVLRGTGDTCKYTFKANVSMAPNVYVHVSLVQPYKNVKNSLPIRLYGVIPIKIENEESHLEPLLLVKDGFEANKKNSFKVKEKNGRKMTFTVAVVDEGLLGINNFKMPNPWNHFYRKEASSLASYDMFNSISGAFNGRIETLLAIGGSEEAVDSHNGSKKAERFKSVAMLLGPYQIEAKQEKIIEFEMPQYMGAVRLMLVAMEGISYGVKEESVKVTSPLIVLSSFPRTLGLGEDIEVPVTVFNGTEKQANIKVSLKGEGAISMNKEKTVNVGPMQNEMVSFNVKADKRGKTLFTIEGRGSANMRAISSVEIDSISRGTPYINVKNELIQGKQEKILTVDLPGEAGTRELSLEISRIPSLGLENRLSYLLDYPSGCLEQITSKAFSQLYLPKFLELSTDEAERRKESILSVLQRYPSYQTSSGGFSYWPQGNEVSSWASVYAFHFMVEAKKMGFSVEDSLYKKSLNYQISSAKTWVAGYRNNPEVQAYRLYALALAGRGDLQVMNKFRTSDELSSLAKSLLANAYIMIGKKDVGKALISDSSLYFEHNRRGVQNYGSSLRDVAMQLQTYTLLEEKNDDVNNCILALANASSSGEYLSTNEIANILISLAPYYNYKKSTSVNLQVFTQNEKQDVVLNMTSKVLHLKVTKENNQNVKVKNSNDEPIYVSLVAKSTLSHGSEKKEEKGGLSLNVGYMRSNRDSNIDDSKSLSMETVDLRNIKKGDRFFVFIKAKNKSNVKLDDLVLSLPIPTGWEISNNRIVDISDDSQRSNYDYQDIQDTHIYTYFSLSKNEEKTFMFEATSVYEGKYYLPSVVLESMYDPAYRAVFTN